jgi:alpha-L-rhamnosidase
MIAHLAVCPLLALVLLAADDPSAPFIAAKAVWPEGRSLEKNVAARFRAVLDIDDPAGAILRVAAATSYRASVNGAHAGYGPARGPHGFNRVDVVDISPRLKKGKNIVAIEVAGYNANSYYTIDEPSFLRAEVVRDGKVLAATGVSGFEASVDSERVQKVQRYSFQRPFSEVYRIRPDHDAWKTDPAAPFAAVPCTIDARTLRHLPRRVPYPEFAVRKEWQVVGMGAVLPRTPPFDYWKDRSLTAIGPKLKGYPEGELKTIPSIEMQKFSYTAETPGTAAPLREPLALEAMRYAILDLGLNDTGFVGLTAEASKPSRLVVAFDEVLSGGDVDWKRLGCVNLIVWELPAGRFDLESFEPNTFRYLKPILLEGACKLSGVHLREYANPDVGRASFRSGDPRLDKLFAAGRETYRQNAVDVFTDCPHRERAGWLCDSFFTARTAMDLSGNADVEKAFIENYLLPERFEFLPEGMLPMCYPADHNDGVFIPNWAMWFVVELEEYLSRTGDRATVEALRPRVTALIGYLRKFRNADGLLERLPSWVFVEWSAANDYVQDVNYPSNMLWAGTLAAAGRMYGLPDAKEEAVKVLETVRRQSYDGTFFVDNAVRRDGSLQITRNRTEVCQYFAFTFGAATFESHPALWATLRDKFGPGRRKENPFPDVGMANSFIGNMLRMELLSKAGLSQQILDESIDYLLYMADRTGTLWENVSEVASCNHGFASHIVHTLYRDVLGLREVDRTGKRVKIVLPPLGLDRCEGALPIPGGEVRLSWVKAGGKIECRAEAPEGWSVEIENRTGLDLAKGAPAASGNWPAWRGPDGTGVSRETGLPVHWSEGAGILWTRELPGWGDSTPAIWGDGIYVTTQDGERLLLLRISKATGEVVWTREVGKEALQVADYGSKPPSTRGSSAFHKNHNLASPSPVTDGERIIVHFGNGDLASYAIDGAFEWKRNLQEDHGKYTIWWGHANSPVLHGDLVISACMQDSLLDIGKGPAESYVVAHEKRTGKLRWKVERKTAARSEPCDSYTTPLLRAGARGIEVVVMGANQLDAYDPLTGRQIWRLPCLDGNRTITGPTAAGGTIYSTIGMRGALVAVRPEGEGDLPPSAVAWRWREATPDAASPVVWGGLLFTVSDIGVASCLDARTGSLKWKERLPGDYRSSPLAAEGRIYLLNMKGLCTVVAASEKFEKLGENPVDDETIASPAVSEGKILLRGKKALRCIAKEAPKPQGAAAGDGWAPLFDGKTLKGWRIVDEVDFESHGEVKVADGAIVLGKGSPMTGIAWTGEVPKEDYEVELEASRLEGSDFFCGLTFRISDSPCTLIVGGWGGSVVGLSNVDGASAVENMTTKWITFDEKRWYRIRLRVTKMKVEAWIDDDQVIDLERGSHRFGVWPQQEYVRPFGFDTWITKGALRAIRMRRVADEAGH